MKLEYVLFTQGIPMISLNTRNLLLITLCLVYSPLYACYAPLCDEKEPTHLPPCLRTARTSIAINTVDKRGKAPLHRAIIDADEHALKDLLERGAHLHVQTKLAQIEAPDFMRSKAGFTAFHLAAHYGNTHFKKLLLYFALLQNTPALLKTFGSIDTSKHVFTISVLQERAIKLKKILELKTAQGDTAAEIERKRREWNKHTSIHEQAPLLSAHKIHTDLQSFVNALTFDTVGLLPTNNIFKAAYEMIPKKDPE